jgi:hypothetical protein
VRWIVELCDAATQTYPGRKIALCSLGTATCESSGGRNLGKASHQTAGDDPLHLGGRSFAPAPYAAIPELNITDWRQLADLSQKERELILKVSGFSAHAWGARGVHLGSDLSHADWTSAVESAIKHFSESPHVLQRYHKPALVEAAWQDFARNELVPMKGRARLCPYYFVIGQGDAARPKLGGVLATICPADKKIIHGMTEAIFSPCVA